ncbi:MAG: hypothetical protein CMH83_13550 [Nocardioides sp.]|nr:hypothetical protein [Nocardioides sp.]
MGTLHTALLRTWLALALAVTARLGRARDERGDVPGWVLVVVMSVGLVGVITTVAEDELTGMVRRALGSVK